MSTANLPTLEVEPDLKVELRAMIAQRSITEAIKRLRAVKGCGMKEAADWVDLQRLRVIWWTKYWPKLCPYCRGFLRSALARQCFDCGMDWHDPDHPVRR